MLRTLLSFRGDRRGLIEATALQDSARVWLRHSAAIAAASLKQLIVLGVAIVKERSFRGDRRGLIEARPRPALPADRRRWSFRGDRRGLIEATASSRSTQR